MTRLDRVLVANRGEVAVRIIRAAQDSGRHAIAVHSDADAGALHVELADSSVAIGGLTAAESYLDPDKILWAAREAAAQGVHPGYGFLSENADFAQLVIGAGLTWVGPPVGAMRSMSDKLSSRQAAERAGVRGVPGIDGVVTDPGVIREFGGRHGWPVAIKASFGGGGRGIRVVREADDVAAALEAAQAEAQRSFGRGECYVERYLPNARHIEVQVLADRAGNVVAVGDRDCSSQRRHQKLVEEAPSPNLSDAVRQQMYDAAVAIASACHYEGAGTLEFLYSQGQFWFLEMNTRLQVEHPVTEMTTGLDIVQQQFRIAEGGVLDACAHAVGHSIECRINSEKLVGKQFLPSTGTITRLDPPDGPWVRFDAGYRAGREVSRHYDNLLGKLVVWAPTRPEACARMVRALRELRIEGVHTNIDSQLRLVSHPTFVAGDVTTEWVQAWIDQRDTKSSD